MVSLPSHGECSALRPGFGHPDAYPGFRGGGARASQVPVEPQCERAPVIYPGGTYASGHCNALVLPPNYATPSAPTGTHSRGWFPAAHSLAVYTSRRHLGRPRKTRFRLLARLYRVGLVTHRALMNGFGFSSSSFTSSIHRLLVVPRSARVLHRKRGRGAQCHWSSEPLVSIDTRILPPRCFISCDSKFARSFFADQSSSSESS